MFQTRRQSTPSGSALRLTELIYHSTVRDLRKGHRNAAIGLIVNIMQTVMFVGVFYVMFNLLGVRGAALRGDFMLYIMSGVFLFMTHTKTMGAVLGSEGPSSAMIQHAPLNTFISICASAISALYIQMLSLLLILFFYSTLITPITIDRPVGALAMVMLSWLFGVGVGLVFLGIKPWFPGFVGMASQLYSRLNMIASGKMFVANTLPAYMIALFDWNPLFHMIDQGRGYIFLHYTPHYTSATYALYVSLVLIVIGMMGESYTRKYASISWDAAR